MQFSDYTTLQAALASYLARDDLTAEIPAFIRLAEARMNRELRVRHMETRATAATVAGEQFMSLPSDFLEMRALVVQATPKSILAYLTPTQIDTTYASNTSGTPAHYTIIGNEFKVGPVPASVYTLELTYYAQIPALDGVTVNSNWVLANYPDLYLYGALLEAEPFVQSDERIQIWMGMYDRAIAAIKGEDARARWSGAPLQQRIDVRVW